MCLKGLGTISIHEGRLQISEAGRKQNESIWNRFYSAFTETGATQTMKTNQMAELKK